MPGPFEEGPVKISYEDSKGKQKMTVEIDFGETQMGPSSAARLVADIIRLLRDKLDVKLPMFKR